MLKPIALTLAVAFGAIRTRLTQAPDGEYVLRPDGERHAVGFHGGYDEEEKWSVISQTRCAKIMFSRLRC